jgi:anti-sigma-K factor RskA
MENRHVDDLVAAYALGALEPAEVDAVERHLQACEACRALLDQARGSVELLLFAAPQVTPPPSLRRQLLARVAQEKAAVTRDEGALDTSEVQSEPTRGRMARLLDALRLAPAPASRTGALLRDLLADPQVLIVTTPGTDDAPGASGRFIVSSRRREAVLVASGLRRPDPGRAYQVWLLRGGQPRPNALFGVNRAGVGYGIVHFDVPWGTFDTVAVTPEPQGGSPAPTGPIVLSGSLVNAAN